MSLAYDINTCVEKLQHQEFFMDVHVVYFVYIYFSWAIQDNVFNEMFLKGIWYVCSSL